MKCASCKFLVLIILTNVLRCFISNAFIKYLDKTECYVFTNYSHISCAGRSEVSLILETHCIGVAERYLCYNRLLINNQLLERQ